LQLIDKFKFIFINTFKNFIIYKMNSKMNFNSSRFSLYFKMNNKVIKENNIKKINKRITFVNELILYENENISINLDDLVTKWKNYTLLIILLKMVLHIINSLNRL
jgi:hypothetical protein